MNMVDDATSTTQSLFAAEETSFAAMELLWQWIERYGIPRALYTDRKNVYVVDEQTRQRAADSGEEALTQFGRACRELGITIIKAYSPEAKGRVERSHGTYQDRLVKELRLAGIETIAASNELLPQFCQQLNQKFAVAARAAADYHRSAKGYDLAAIFCYQEERTITADWVVRFENRFYQLAPRRKGQPRSLHGTAPTLRRRGPAGEAERDQGLELGADRLRKNRCRPIGRDADDQRRAVDDRAEGKIAECRLVDHVDRDTRCARRRGERNRLVIGREGADRNRGARQVAGLPGPPMDDDRVSRVT